MALKLTPDAAAAPATARAPVAAASGSAASEKKSKISATPAQRVAAAKAPLADAPSAATAAMPEASVTQTANGTTTRPKLQTVPPAAAKRAKPDTETFASQLNFLLSLYLPKTTLDPIFTPAMTAASASASAAASQSLARVLEPLAPLLPAPVASALRPLLSPLSAAAQRARHAALCAALAAASAAYYNSPAPLLPDAVFDLLLAETEALEALRPALRTAQSPTATVGADVRTVTSATTGTDLAAGTSFGTIPATAKRSAALSRLQAWAAAANDSDASASASAAGDAAESAHMRHRVPMLSLTSTFDPAAVVRFAKATARAHWRPLLTALTVRDGAHAVAATTVKTANSVTTLLAVSERGPPASGANGIEDEESSNKAAAGTGGGARKVNKKFTARTRVPLYVPLQERGASAGARGQLPIAGDARTKSPVTGLGVAEGASALVVPAPAQARATALLGQWSLAHSQAPQARSEMPCALQAMPHALATARLASLLMATLPQEPQSLSADTAGGQKLPLSAEAIAGAGASRLLLSAAPLLDRAGSPAVALLTAHAHAALPWVAALARLRFAKIHAEMRLSSEHERVTINDARNRGRALLLSLNHNGDAIDGATGDASAAAVYPPLAHTLELKYDGMALSLAYSGGALATAATRGNGAVGTGVRSRVRRLCPALPTALHGPSHGADAAAAAGGAHNHSEGRGGSVQTSSGQKNTTQDRSAAGRVSHNDIAGDKSSRYHTALHSELAAALAPMQAALARVLVATTAQSSATVTSDATAHSSLDWASMSGQDVWALLPTEGQAEVALAHTVWTQSQAAWGNIQTTSSSSDSDAWAAFVGLVSAPMTRDEYDALVRPQSLEAQPQSPAQAVAPLWAGTVEVRGELLLHDAEFARINEAAAIRDTAAAVAAAAAEGEDVEAAASAAEAAGMRFSSPRNLIVGILGRDDVEPAVAAAAEAEAAADAAHALAEARSDAKSGRVGGLASRALPGDVVSRDPLSPNTRAVFVAYTLMMFEDLSLPTGSRYSTNPNTNTHADSAEVLSSDAGAAAEAAAATAGAVSVTLTLAPLAARAVAATVDTEAAAHGLDPLETDALLMQRVRALAASSIDDAVTAMARAAEPAALARAAAALLPHHARLSLMRSMGFTVDPYATVLTIPPSEHADVLTSDRDSLLSALESGTAFSASVGPSEVLLWPDLDSPEELNFYSESNIRKSIASDKAAKKGVGLEQAVGEYVQSLASASLAFAGVGSVDWSALTLNKTSGTTNSNDEESDVFDEINRGYSAAVVRTATERAASRSIPLPFIPTQSPSQSLTQSRSHPMTPLFRLASAYLFTVRRHTPLRTDGLVLKVSDSVATMALGAASRSSRAAIAVKAPAALAAAVARERGEKTDTSASSKATPAATDASSGAGIDAHNAEVASLVSTALGGAAAVTRLLGVSVQIGRSGRATPVASLAPVQLGGATVARATLHHHGAVGDADGPLAGLRRGDLVVVERRGDIIPMVKARLPDHLQQQQKPQQRKSTQCDDESDKLLPRGPCGSYLCPCGLKTKLARKPLIAAGTSAAGSAGGKGRRASNALSDDTDFEQLAFEALGNGSAGTSARIAAAATGTDADAFDDPQFSPTAQPGWSAALFCPLPLLCPAQSLRRLAHFVSKGALDVDGLSARTLAQLRAAGLLHVSLPGLAALALDTETRRGLCRALGVPLLDGDGDGGDREWLPHPDLLPPRARARDLLWQYDQAYGTGGRGGSPSQNISKTGVANTADAAEGEDQWEFALPPAYRLPLGPAQAAPVAGGACGVYGWQTRKAHRMLTALSTSLAEQPLPRLLTALGVPGLGPAVAALLLRRFNGDVRALFAATPADLAGIKGIGGENEGAAALAAGLREALKRDAMPLALLGVPTFAPLLTLADDPQANRRGCSVASNTTDADDKPKSKKTRSSKDSGVAVNNAEAGADLSPIDSASVSASLHSPVHGNKFAITGSLRTLRGEAALMTAAALAAAAGDPQKVGAVGYLLRALRGLRVPVDDGAISAAAKANDAHARAKYAEMVAEVVATAVDPIQHALTAATSRTGAGASADATGGKGKGRGKKAAAETSSTTASDSFKPEPWLKPLSRGDLSALLAAGGAETAGSVGRGVTALVLGGGDGGVKESSKSAAAAKSGVPVMGEAEAIRRLLAPKAVAVAADDKSR